MKRKIKKLQVITNIIACMMFILWCNIFIITCNTSTDFNKILVIILGILLLVLVAIIDEIFSFLKKRIK